MSNLVTFFAKSDDGSNELVGIGLTDEVIEHLKRSHGILEEAKRNGMSTDVVVMYAPTLNELMQLINTVVPKEKMEVKFI